MMAPSARSGAGREGADDACPNDHAVQGTVAGDLDVRDRFWAIKAAICSIGALDGAARGVQP
jgi:hypothetical protein